MTDQDPHEPAPFAPTEDDSPKDPETGAPQIDEPEVGGPPSEDDEVDPPDVREPDVPHVTDPEPGPKARDDEPAPPDVRDPEHDDEDGPDR